MTSSGKCGSSLGLKIRDRTEYDNHIAMTFTNLKEKLEEFEERKVDDAL